MSIGNHITDPDIAAATVERRVYNFRIACSWECRDHGDADGRTYAADVGYEDMAAYENLGGPQDSECKLLATENPWSGSIGQAIEKEPW